MDEKQYNKIGDYKSETSSITAKYTIAGILFGLFFPIIAWIIDLSLNNLELSFWGLWNMHTSNPIHFVIDLAPIVLGLVAYILAYKFKQIQSNLETKLREKDANIQRNVEFAKTIGEKNFTVKFETTDDDELGKSLLIMRNNLAEADKKEADQNWISKGKDKISNVLRQHNNLDQLAYETLVTLIKYTKTVQGAFYVYDDDKQIIRNVATYAYNRKKYVNQEFKIGEGLIGQAAYEMDYIYRKEIPQDYISITSGILGDKKPSTILIVPLISDEKLQGTLEFASLDEEISELTITFLRELAEIIGQTVFNLKVNARTEKLLKEARIMTEELQENEEELRQNAEEMRATQDELQKTNKNLQEQIREVENAQKRLHSLLENASEVISIYDEHGIVKYESPSVKHILGYSPEDVIGKNAFESIHTAEDNPTKGIFFELLENPDTPKTFEFQYTKQNAEVIWLETTGRNFLDNQAIQGIIFNTRDITVRKIAEQAQRMSGQMQALSENSLDMIIRLNLKGKFFYANPVVEKMTGIKKDEIIGKTLNEVPFDDKVIKLFHESLKKTIDSKKITEKETTFPTIEDEKIMFINAIPEFDDEKALETVLIVAHDITEQKQIEKEIKDKNKKINDSINYAKRIQSAIIPNNSVIREFLPESFIFYKPRDVVSGDFPWFFDKGDIIYIAAVDCTGHGVPGAMLSFIGYFLLNNIVDHDDDFSAAYILDKLHEEVRKTLRQDKANANARDGMDIAFCKINFAKNEIQYSGAHRPLYLLRDNTLKQFKGNPKAIGGIPPRRKAEKKFINHKFTIETGDKIFFFSDGLPDQVGGENGRKYQAKRIREKITTYPDYSMSRYSKLFARDFLTWKGDYKQIDDVLLIGIEF